MPPFLFFLSSSYGLPCLEWRNTHTHTCIFTYTTSFNRLHGISPNQCLLAWSALVIGEENKILLCCQRDEAAVDIAIATLMANTRREREKKWLTGGMTECLCVRECQSEWLIRPRVSYGLNDQKLSSEVSLGFFSQSLFEIWYGRPLKNKTAILFHLEAIFSSLLLLCIFACSISYLSSSKICSDKQSVLLTTFSPSPSSLFLLPHILGTSQVGSRYVLFDQAEL